MLKFKEALFVIENECDNANVHVGRDIIVPLVTVQKGNEKPKNSLELPLLKLLAGAVCVEHTTYYVSF